jgi:cell division protein FtsI (penicillin-binding protein 3)
VVQDPDSGALLAVANWPRFNPNSPAESSPEARMDRAIGALYEPGSTFKIFTLAAALEEGLTRPDEVVDCQRGAIYLAGHRIRDHKPFGLLTVSEVVAQSSDVGAIKIGLRVGAPRLYDSLRKFGFGSPTDIDLPGESRGLLRGVENWSAISIGAISMGQEVGVTPVQLTSSVSAIANGGLVYRPRVVRELRWRGRVTAIEQPAPRRVVQPTTAATLRRMLEGVVREGTGTLARLDGYTAAGKTGTAQKIDPSTGRYSLSQYIASFVGFAPLNNAAVTILIALDSPVGPHHGGDVAAPVFKRVAEQVLAYLDVPHDLAILPTLLRASLQQEARQEEADVSDFDPVQAELVAEAADPTPSPGQQGARAPAFTVGPSEGGGVAVPTLKGKTVRRVTEECLRSGLNPVLVGNGVAVEQVPQPGVAVRRGSRVTVWFARSLAVLTTSGRRN